jgi:DNA primase catalytic subunit
MRTHYMMPEGMRYSGLGERRRFYSDEFDAEKLVRWMGDRRIGGTVFAAILGRHTGIYPRKHRALANTTVVLDDLSNQDELRAALLDYLPEGAYYDRNVYKDRSKCSLCARLTKCFRCKNFLGQELAFDIDPENVSCPVHGDLEDRMRHRQGLGFCRYEFDVARIKTCELYEFLGKRFSDLRIVYSGRGFHIHVLDKEAYVLSVAQRWKLAAMVLEKSIPIDEWITSGDMRLIRLPYSLHGMVSRVCMPLSLRDMGSFDPIRDKKALPRFL